MRLITLVGFDERLRPMSKRDLYRRAARRAAIERLMARTAKASEQHLPEDERRQVIDLAELGAASLECAVACAVAAPVAITYVICCLL